MRMVLLVALLLLSGDVTAQAAMARVWIAEFAAGRVEAAAPFAQLPAITTQPTLDISVTRQVSAPFNAQARYIRIVCEVTCVIRTGGTVTQNDIMLPANRPEYFGVSPGNTVSVTAVPP